MNWKQKVDRYAELRQQVNELSGERNKLLNEIRSEIEPKTTEIQGENSRLKVKKRVDTVLNRDSLYRAIKEELKEESPEKVEKFYQSLIARLPKRESVTFS